MTVPTTTAAPDSRLASPESVGPVLRVDGLAVQYSNGMRALKGADLTIARGEKIAIVGESGSGKSTLALAVAGFLKASETAEITGVVTFEGRPVAPAQDHLFPRRTPGIAMVFQDAMTSLDPVWTIGSQLRAIIHNTERISRSDSRLRAEEWLHRVGLTDTRRVMGARPYELSGGMRQRVMMALALASRPTLLIADEPTSALDASLARATMDLLVGLTDATGVALMIVSHDIDLCSEYVDTLVVMLKGDIVETGPAELLTTAAQHPYTQGLLHCVPTLQNAEDETLPTLASFMAAAAAPRTEHFA